MITVEQRVRFGILCALQVCDKPYFVTWAKNWLAGSEEAQLDAGWMASEAWKWQCRPITEMNAETRASAARAAEAVAAIGEAIDNAAWAAVSASAATAKLDLIDLAHEAMAKTEEGA